MSSAEMGESKKSTALMQPDFLEEYKDASANMRHYGRMRFAHLALFMVAMGCLLKTVFPPDLGLSKILVVTLKIAGIILTVVFAVLHHRVVCHFQNYRKRAVELEKNYLGFSQHSSRNENPRVRAATALWVIYLAFLVLWTAALFQ